MRRSLLLAMVVAAGCGLGTPAAAVPRCLYISGTADALRKAQEFVDTMAPRGGTDPLPAITRVYPSGAAMAASAVRPNPASGPFSPSR